MSAPLTRNSCTHLVCNCGTTVLFPSGVDARTCWKCGAFHQLQAHETHSGPSLEDSQAETSRMDNPSVASSSFSKGSLIWALLAVSCAINGTLIAGRSAAVGDCPRSDLGGNAHVQQIRDAFVLDSDGDGVPDQHDFCPSSTCSPGDVLCAPSGWISGRATDFDADGCADGTEDVDKDNDGILDERDRCPLTPQKYAFVSNAYSDFDGDGCADWFEDSDDDGDAVPNSVDSCPRTAPWDVSDSSGCSQFQHERPETLELHRIMTVQSTMHSPARTAPLVEQKEEQPTRFQEWIHLFQGAGVELAVGAVLSFAFGKAYDAYRKLQEKIPTDPSDSIQRLSSGFAAGMSSVRQRSSSSFGSIQRHTLRSFLASWAPSRDSLALHIFRVAAYLFVVYVSRYHRDCLSIEALRSGLSSGAIWLASGLESFATSVSGV